MGHATRSTRPRRTQTRSQVAASVPIESGNHDVDQRRERKRATDREAQREHRKRQKEHIEELETQLEFVKQTSCTKQVVALMAENEKLHQELKKLRAFFVSVENLVSVQQRDEAEQQEQPILSSEARETFEPRHEEPHSPANLQAYSTATSSPEEIEGFHNIDPSVSLHRQDVLDAEALAVDRTQMYKYSGTMAGHSNLTGLRTVDPNHPSQMHVVGGSQHPHTNGGEVSSGNSYIAGHVSDLNLDWWSLPPDITGFPSDFNATFSGAPNMPPWLRNLFSSTYASPGGPVQEIEAMQFRGRPNWLGADHNMPDLRTKNHAGQPMSLDKVRVGQTSSPYPARNDGTATAAQAWEQVSTLGHNANSQAGAFEDSAYATFQGQIMESATTVLFQQLPCLLMPPLAADRPLHDTADRERRAVASNLRYSSAPTWTDFLVDDPSNPLSLSIKSYIQPMQKFARTSEVLTSYWIIYLLLRWQINLTRESYNDIPPWLRPTQLQRTIRHPISAGFMPWPYIRDDVILRSFNNPDFVTEVMTALGTYLEVDLTVTHALILHDNGEQLNSVIADLRNWKLRDGFFVKYPQWRGLCERSISDFYDSE